MIYGAAELGHIGYSTKYTPLKESSISLTYEGALQERIKTTRNGTFCVLWRLRLAALLVAGFFLCADYTLISTAADVLPQPTIKKEYG